MAVCPCDKQRGARMSRALGIGVLVIGTTILGWWGQTQNAHRIENQIREAASLAASGSLHGVTTWVSGRDIHLAGIVDSPEEEASLFAALDAVPGRRVIVSEVSVLPKQQPFTLVVAKTEGLTASGFVPSEAARAALAKALDNQAAGLTLASGAPAGWLDLAKAGIAALGPLNHGEMRLSDTPSGGEGRIAVEDFADGADAVVGEVAQEGEQIGTGRGRIPIHFVMGCHKRANQPPPHRSLMVSPIPFDPITPIHPLIIRMAGG